MPTPLECYTNASSLPLWDGESEHDEQGIFLRHIHFCLCFLVAELTMKIAVTYENGQIFQHFGHTSQFKVYEIQNNQITSSQVVDTAGSGHGALAGFLMEHGIDTIICGGIGGGAQNALAQAGIKLYGGVGGVAGDADAAVQALLENNLQFNPNVQCSHHDHQHGQEGHTCGSHGCGSNHSCH